MKKLKFLSLVLGTIVALPSLFVSCKKENIEKNTSDVRLAIVGARAVKNGSSTIVYDISLQGSFLSSSDFNVLDYGIIIYPDSTLNANADSTKRFSTGAGRTSPGTFELNFQVSEQSNVYVGLFAKTKNGEILSTNYTSAKAIIEGYAVVPRLMIRANKPDHPDGDTISFVITTPGTFIQNISLFNAGLSDLNIADISINPSCSLSIAPGYISPGTHKDLLITFNTNSFVPGKNNFNLNMNTNDPSRPYAYVVVQIMYQPSSLGVFKLEDKGINFPDGHTFDFYTTTGKSLTMKNDGSGDLTVNSVTFSTGDYITSFPSTQVIAATSGYAMSIERTSPPPLANCTMTIVTDAGTYTYTLTAAPATAYELWANAAPHIDYSTFGFNPGYTTQTFEIRNTNGTADLTGISVTTNSPNFVVTTAPASTVIAGDYTTFVISCTSTATENADFTVYTNDGNHSYYLNYTGAVTPVGCELRDAFNNTISPGGLLSFNTNESRSFSLFNTAAVSVNVTFFDATGGITWTTPPTTVNPGNGEPISLTAPATPGTGQLTINYSDGASYSYDIEINVP